MKLFLNPSKRHVPNDNGIGQVIHAQYKYLPAHDVEFARNPEEADIIASHIQGNEFPRLDVLHNHGLYWTGDNATGWYEQTHHLANSQILESVRRAKVLTVPSEWVAVSFRRDMRINPFVVGHGINLSDWNPKVKKGNYVLWNKNRAGDVCNPIPIYQMAKRGVEVVSTLGIKDLELPKTMLVTGILPFEEMKKHIQKARIYLSIAPETFGIGLLEAMACGAPVLGYNWGNVSNLVEHKKDGYLVKPNDFEGLMEGYDWLNKHWEKCSERAIEKAGEYSWEKVIGKYVEVYQAALGEQKKSNGKVAIIITNYNYQEYVGTAIESALAQTIPCEVVVVDDGSTDESWAAIGKYGRKIKVIEQENQGVAAARNKGISETDAEYVICLDADDRLDARYSEICKDALEKDAGLGIAFTGLGYLTGDAVGPNVWQTDFNWESQATPHNPPSTTIHCAAMFRRKAWERVGGYRQKYAPAEDAELWMQMTGIGFRAKRVTDEPLFHYRYHPESHSQVKEYRSYEEDYPFMRDKVFPMAAPAKVQPLVRSYSKPLVSVIIPVGPGHSAYLPDAIRSVMAQSVRDWEIVVASDGENIKDALKPFPFVRIFETRSNGKTAGAGVARNIALRNANAPFIFFLDADDLIDRFALESLLLAYQGNKAGYIYSDWKIVKDDLSEELGYAPEYDQQAWFRRGQHAVSVLMATEDAREVMFDEEMQGWEDWDFFAKCAVKGICGQRVAQHLLTYRHFSGSRREKSLKSAEQLLAYLRKKYHDYTEGIIPMGTCCGGNADALLEARGFLPMRTANSAPPIPPGKIRMQYIGPERGPVTYYVNGHAYAGANTDEYRFVDALEADTARLEAMGVWKRARIKEEAILPPEKPKRR